MKKIFAFVAIFLCFMPFLRVNTTFAETDTATFVVTANSANVYESSSLASNVLYALSHKDEVQIEIESDIPKTYEIDGYVFYKVIKNAEEGFILSDFVVKKTSFLQQIPNFNAKTNDKCTVYSLQDGNYTQTDITLKNKQKIYLYEGYKSKKEYTAICFVYNNEVMYGYIKTEFVNPNGINPIIITVICLVVAILGIAFTFVFIRGKKKKMS